MRFEAGVKECKSQKNRPKHRSGRPSFQAWEKTIEILAGRTLTGLSAKTRSMVRCYRPSLRAGPLFFSIYLSKHGPTEMLRQNG
jgi:hypothetical protein